MNTYNTIEPESLDIMLDFSTRSEPIIGVKINSTGNTEYIIPLPIDVAHEVGVLLMGHVAAIRNIEKRLANA